MQDLGHMMASDDPEPVLVLGTDDIASAIGHALASARIRTVLVRDAGLPVLRRSMSFDDAVEYGFAELDGVTAYAADLPLLRGPLGLLSVTDRQAEELLDPMLIEGVIDARMRRREEKRDLRGALDFAIGLRPGFSRLVYDFKKILW
jgi:xanthine dehydrogenase accessory factor